MQNDYECPRCHNVFPSSNKTMHDIRCTEQNPLPLDQNKMEISKENENKEEEKMIPGPKIFTNDGNDNNDNFINNNNNNFVNNNENNFEDNNKNNLMEEPPLDDFPEVFECDKCHELIYESEREDHMLCHQYQNEEDNRINNPRNQIRISKINVEEQKRIEKQIEQNKRKNMINQNQIRQNNSSNNNNRNNNNNYQNIFYNDFGDNILNNNNNNYIPNLNSINNNNNNNPYIRPNNRNRIRNYNNINNNNHINNNNNNNRQHNRIRPNTGINHYNNNNNNINQRVQVTIRQTGPNGEVISRFYPAYDIQNVQNVHRIRRNNNNNNNNNRNNIEHPQPFVYLSSHRNFPFHNINNRQSIGTMFQELFSDLENSGIRATDRDILNELPETNIEDVSKLDSDKKNCVICLEDFKNREKAIILPCIHLFHKNCIKSWLKKNNSCPICKFKLTRDNLMGQNNNFE